MSIVLNFLIAAAGIGGFAGICALSQKARMHILFVSSTASMFILVVAWAVAKHTSAL